MEIATKVPPEVETALGAAVDWLRAQSVDEVALARSLGVARVCAEFTENCDLSVAALVHEATADNAALDARLESGIGAEVAAAVRGLATLGDFRLPADWQPDQRLGGGQAESLRRMLLASAQDPRLIVARLAAVLVDLRTAKTRPALVVPGTLATPPKPLPTTCRFPMGCLWKKPKYRKVPTWDT